MRVIGLMSGTSADGVDAALCDLSGAPPSLEARIVHANFVPFEVDFQQRIYRAGHPETSHIDDLCELNFELGERFSAAVLKLIAEAQLKPQDIDLIGLHGQTVWHMVQSDGKVTSTLQLTEASVLAHRTGITTVSNFRPRDIIAGGQGAPLTSYADWLLLRHPTHWRAVQNIGGIGNVTFLPPLNDIQHQPMAYDTGPGNSLIDGVVLSLTGRRFDSDGVLAEQGRVDEEWLAELLTHPYFERKPPKTTGRELFGADMAKQLIAQGKQRGLNTSDMVRTVTAFTAASIADAYHRFAPMPIDEVIVGGGGKHNTTLMTMIADWLPQTNILSHEDIGLDSDNKEALVFAVLAYETWHARPGNHPALTGAGQAVVLGQITPGNNYVDLVQKTWCELAPDRNG